LNISLDSYNTNVRSQSSTNTNMFATSQYSNLFGGDYSKRFDKYTTDLPNMLENSSMANLNLDTDFMSQNIFAGGFALGGAGYATLSSFLSAIQAVGTEPIQQPSNSNIYSADYLKYKSRENIENYAYAPSKNYDKFDGTFESALKNVLGSEGGYSNDPDDHGGPTNHGITQRTYDSWCSRNGKPQQDVKNITQEEVKNIYYNDYWLASGADKVSDPKMKLALFDTSVLHGVSGAKKIYKQSDGSVNGFLEARKNSYNEIVDNNPSQQKFYNGWMNRVNRLG
jgi:hypothetical protein